MIPLQMPTHNLVASSGAAAGRPDSWAVSARAPGVRRHMVGTLEYMAPEVLLKEPASCASDIYAFAVTINELATGVFPFSDCTRDNPQAHTVLEMGYGRCVFNFKTHASDAMKNLEVVEAPRGCLQTGRSWHQRWQVRACAPCRGLPPRPRFSAYWMPAGIGPLLHGLMLPKS